MYHPLYAPYEQDIIISETITIFHLNPIYLLPIGNNGKPYILDSSAGGLIKDIASKVSLNFTAGCIVDASGEIYSGQIEVSIALITSAFWKAMPNRF